MIQDADFPEGQTTEGGRSAQGFTGEMALAGLRLWACAGAPVAFAGTGQHEPKVSVGLVVVTAGAPATIYFKDHRGNLKPFPVACLGATGHDLSGGGGRIGGWTNEYMQVYGGVGTFYLSYIAVGI